MTFTPVTRLTVFYEPLEGSRQVVGRLLRHRHELLFEFDPSFLGTGLQLSPFRLPLRPGVVRGHPRLFDGLMGLFDDSLPDGWGRLLMRQQALRVETGEAEHFVKRLRRVELPATLAETLAPSAGRARPRWSARRLCPARPVTTWPPKHANCVRAATRAPVVR